MIVTRQYEYCGEIAGSRDNYQSYDNFVGAVTACSEYHAELLLSENN